MLWSARRKPTRHLGPRERLKELYKAPERRPDHPVRTNQIARKYAPVIGTYVRAFAPKEGVSGGDENARQHYVLRRTY